MPSSPFRQSMMTSIRYLFWKTSPATDSKSCVGLFKLDQGHNNQSKQNTTLFGKSSEGGSG